MSPSASFLVKKVHKALHDIAATWMRQSENLGPGQKPLLQHVTCECEGNCLQYVSTKVSTTRFLSFYLDHESMMYLCTFGRDQVYCKE